jgi:hypothetical protein
MLDRIKYLFKVGLPQGLILSVSRKQSRKRTSMLIAQLFDMKALDLRDLEHGQDYDLRVLEGSGQIMLDIFNTGHRPLYHMVDGT